MKINARKMALRILGQIDTEKSFSHIALNRYFDQYDMDSVDRRFISYLVLGVLENKMLLDFYIRKLSKLRFGKIHHEVVNILRMGLYQIEFMSKVPDSAAVDECVKLAKKISPEQGKYVNGVLRTFIREKNKIELPDAKRHPSTHLSILYSHPEWLVERWIAQFGKNFTETLLKANNNRPNLIIRVNPLKITVSSLQKRLDEAGVVYEPSLYIKDALVIKSLNALSFETLPGFEEGLFQVQDESSMFVGILSDVKAGQTVVDVCAAPGGKATHVAQLMNNTGVVYARDLHEHKLSLIMENVERLGLKNVKAQVFDAALFDKELEHKADVVLVDAPCSGLGIIRRKPDIKYNKSIEELAGLSDLQKRILSTSSEYVKDQGTLIYSTCTLNLEENEAVVNWFLEHHPKFRLDRDQGGHLSKARRMLLTEKGIDLVMDTEMLKLFPNKHGTDGFFIAKMIKIG
ncbi:16S rRNA (cytosine(967)-C(5))-methyltransferase RsmB [Fusibacter ferrireducens]|uniref:16S rRNA (cytosine(967)-C(5))-methyltransferase n=1 Tax=Fusibacter ferrireducens TaxID=2785058 RepID=A0ABR9ZMI8_9FIRM|nr:16S rRNA (cytosine(967)-C(5))-methyltransferase RsmB [Fusibacter ferrireducens]MBF4691673.1 16S rRNA (cytosine(967)-C(5))-methyltransferase RsmB [Fusibacter ferrireducens]